MAGVGTGSVRAHGAQVELTDAVARRHMTRNFTTTPLDPGVVDALLDSALRAPSAGNTQGREFVVLEGPAETWEYWQATTDQDWRDTSRRFAGLSRAPVVVLVFADPEAYEARYREPDKARADGVEVEWVVPFWFVDAAFATMTLLLAATDRGIGAALLGNFRGEDRLRSALGVPERLRWLGAVLLGEPARPDPPSTSAARPRRAVEESVHRGRWKSSTPVDRED
jgi:nitroreductase